MALLQVRDSAGAGRRSPGLATDHRRAALREQLDALPTLSRSGLVARWIAVIGHPPPSGLSRRLLALAVAYHLQVQALGGLAPGIRRQLFRNDESSGQGNGKRPSLRLAPGMRLVRHWQGRTHTVEVVADGFLYLGQRYRSLSAIARTITGTRWSGPKFFLP